MDREPGSGGTEDATPGAAPAYQLACPPKINLYLRVVRRREDGFHELETVFQSVGGGDTLAASLAARLS
jgi:4-diphosphocytidyl-2C-methyl-D-erythritol kinase